MFKRATLALCCLFVSCCALAQSSRHFTFRYDFTVRDVDEGKSLRVWIPLAHSNDFQTVRVVSRTGDLPLKVTKEKQPGNEMLYAETGKATKSEYKFSVVYDVVRRERIALTDAERQASENSSGPAAPALKRAAFRQYLAPEKLVPTTGEPAEIAAKVVAGKSGDLQRGRAIYDYVLANMRYDKSGTGWGHGDALWACDSKRGNCTDFHSLFISMARSQGIPARFEIGFAIPRDKHEGEIPGYHCWAEFYTAEHGWVPVDISEAWQDKSRAQYFFGAHDDNRVAFTGGRDLVLSPPQSGEPLNFFVYPYVEVGGQKYEDVSNHFSFADVM